MGVKRIQFEPQDSQYLGQDFMSYLKVLEEDFFQHEDLLAEEPDLNSEEVVDYMISTYAVRSLDIVGELGFMISDNLDRLAEKEIRRQADEHRQLLNRIDFDCGGGAPLGVGLGVSGLGAGFGLAGLLGAEGVKERAVDNLTRAGRQAYVEAYERFKRKERTPGEIQEYVNDRCSDQYRSIVERAKKARRELFLDLLNDIFNSVQIANALMDKGFAIEEGVDPNSKGKIGVELFLLNNITYLDENPGFTEADRRMIGNTMLTMLLARTFQVFVEDGFEVPEDAESEMKGMADEQYQEFLERIGGVTSLCADTIDLDTPLPVSRIVYSDGRDNISYVNCKLNFTLPNGSEVEVPYSLSRFTPDLVMEGSWSNSTKRIFESYGMGFFYEQIRYSTLEGLNKILEASASEEDEAEQTCSEWEGWWLEYEEDSTEEVELKKLKPEEGKEELKKIKGLRTKISGLAMRKARRAFERLGLQFEKGGIDFVVKGCNCKTGKSCMGIFPGEHGYGKSSANQTAAIRHLCRKFGISREDFLHALAK